jgi:hypothetical protein
MQRWKLLETKCWLLGCLMGLIDFCDEEVMGSRLADNHNSVLYYSDEMPCYLTFVISLLFVSASEL